MLNLGIIMMIVGTVMVLGTFFSTAKRDWWDYTAVAFMLVLWTAVYAAERNFKKEKEHGR